VIDNVSGLTLPAWLKHKASSRFSGKNILL
jgi:hypothetical protein